MSHENPLSQEAVDIATNTPQLLCYWQQYLLSCFPRDKYVSVPDYARYLAHMWRHRSWEAFVTDTVVSNGTQMATLLSLAYKPKVIVEMGIDAGFTTLQFCKLNPQAQVYGVDIHSRNSDSGLPICFHAQMNNVSNLTLVLGRPSWEFLLPGKVDLCFIDACHTGDAPLKDTLTAWENRNVDGNWCIAWDDYHPNNPDVVRAVDQLCSKVGMELQKVGSWVFIGKVPATELKQYGMQ